MKYYDKNKESSYLTYWDVNNLYFQEVPQKLPSSSFKQVKETSKFNEEFIKSYNDVNDEEYFPEVVVQYLENLHNFHNNLHCSAERIKIEKAEKLVANLHNKTEYVIRIINLKQALNHGLVLKKVHRIIKFNGKAWLKRYIDMNLDLRKKAKNDFQKDFFKLMNDAVFGKTMKRVRSLNLQQQKKEDLVLTCTRKPKVPG